MSKRSEADLLKTLDSILEDQTPTSFNDTSRMLEGDTAKLVELSLKGSTDLQYLYSLKELIEQQISILEEGDKLSEHR